jgi:hypothetical protein
MGQAPPEQTTKESLMCLICVDFQKQKMTTQDARRALREMSSTLDDEHVKEVREMIRKQELEDASTANKNDKSP